MSLLSRAEEYLKQAEDQANLLLGGDGVGGESFDRNATNFLSSGGSPGSSFPLSRHTPTRGAGGFNSRLPRVSVADIPSRYSLSLSFFSFSTLDVRLLVIQIFQQFMKLLIMI
jgi:hypothetical protein